VANSNDMSKTAKESSFMHEDILDILGNRNRRKILEVLAEKPRTVAELDLILNPGAAEEDFITTRGIRKILDILEEKNIVAQIESDHPSGGRKQIFYYITQRISGSFSIEPNKVTLSLETENIPNIDPQAKNVASQPDSRQKIFAEVQQNYAQIEELDHRLLALENEKNALLRNRHALYNRNLHLTAILRNSVQNIYSYGDFGSLLPAHMIAIYRDLQILKKMFDLEF